MADVVTISGTLVGASERPYEAYPDRKTGELRPGGVTRSLYVSPSFSDAPVEVKCSDPANFSLATEHGFGSEVVIECELRAWNSNISRLCRSVREAKPATRRPVRAA